jgi:uncharacterized LabA/DUF88 family protein
MQRVITYIDGFNLYYGLRQAGFRRFYWLDVEKLSAALLKPEQQLAKVKYFTSRVKATPADPNQHRRQQTYLEALSTLPLTTCLFGQYLSSRITCRACNTSWPKHEEKMTDVNIAIELLVDAFQNAFDTAILISGDSDLVGPLEKVRELFPAKRLIVAFPPERVSKRLQQVAHHHFIIGRAKLASSQLANPVQNSAGFQLSRPTEWS